MKPTIILDHEHAWYIPKVTKRNFFGKPIETNENCSCLVPIVNDELGDAKGHGSPAICEVYGKTSKEAIERANVILEALKKIS